MWYDSMSRSCFACYLSSSSTLAKAFHHPSINIDLTASAINTNRRC